MPHEIRISRGRTQKLDICAYLTWLLLVLLCLSPHHWGFITGIIKPLAELVERHWCVSRKRRDQRKTRSNDWISFRARVLTVFKVRSQVFTFYFRWQDTPFIRSALLNNAWNGSEMEKNASISVLQIFTHFLINFCKSVLFDDLWCWI